MLRLWVTLHLAISLIADPSASASLCNDELASTEIKRQQAQDFLNDSRFRWAKETLPWISDEEATRKPPNVFPSSAGALYYRPLNQLPEGLTQSEKVFYQGVFSFLRDNGRVFDQLKAIEADLKSQSLESLLETGEARYGLKKVDIESRLDTQDWLELVAQGAVAHDTFGNHIQLVLSDGIKSYPGHWLHGADSHRLQLFLVIRDVESRPSFYGLKENEFKKLREFYINLGSTSFNDRLDWSNTSLAKAPNGTDRKNLFFQFFDSPENNGSSPGFYFEYREYWPALGKQLGYLP